VNIMGELEKNQPMSLVRTTVSQDMFEVMEKAYKFSQIMAKSDIIPLHYRGKPENVFVAIQTAYRMNLDPMLVMQNTFVVSGKLGMNSSFAIALANSSGLFESGIRYSIKSLGEDLEGTIIIYENREKKSIKKKFKNIEVTAYAMLKNGGEISYTIGMKEAIAENWASNIKYQNLPELMLRYRAATLLIRTHVPEVINGMHMVEEIEDVAIAKEVTTPKPTAISKLDKFLEQEEVKPAEEGLRVQLSSLIVSRHIPQETVQKWCEAGGVDSLNELDDAKIKSCIEYVESKGMVNGHACLNSGE